MARGHPDYYGRNVPSMGVYGGGQTNFLFAADANIAGGAFAVIAAYLVPAGLELHFMGGIMTCNFPGICRLEIFVDLATIANIYFDMEVQLPLHPAAAYVVTAGQTMSFIAYNLDDIAHHFAGGGAGFLLEVAT